MSLNFFFFRGMRFLKDILFSQKEREKCSFQALWAQKEHRNTKIFEVSLFSFSPFPFLPSTFQFYLFILIFIVAIVTWNVGNAPPPDSLYSAIAQGVDLCYVCLQECEYGGTNTNVEQDIFNSLHRQVTFSLFVLLPFPLLFSFLFLV